MATLAHAGTYTGPEPVIHPESEPFWRGLGDERLTLQRCSSCGRVRWPIAPVCHVCGSLEYAWSEVSGEGTVSAAVVVKRATADPTWAKEVPYLTGMIDLPEGLRLPGRVLCDCGEGARHGTAVRAARFSTDDGYGVLCFVHGCRR
jgi:uncharacterized OB-fold protein